MHATEIMESVISDVEEQKTNRDEILRHIYQKCKKESTRGLQRPLKEYEERVLYYTKVPKCVLQNIHGHKSSPFENLDLFDRAVISAVIRDFFDQGKSFTYTDIYHEVQEKIKVPELLQFCRDLRSLGYIPVNTLNFGPIIMEEPKQVFDRFHYLNRIKKLRANNRNIYYIDERKININKKIKKIWMQDTDKTKCDEYIFFHIINNNGLQAGLFCNQANAEDFHKWVSEIVMDTLQPCSVVIMDKSPLHEMKLNDPISRYHSKEDMLNWLKSNNVPCSQNMRKAELYDLIARLPVKMPQFFIDHIFKANGHELLFLPKNYHDLSPTELMWEVIYSGFNSNTNTDDWVTIKSTVYNSILSIPKDRWGQFESAIIGTENNIFEIDETIEKSLNAYKIDFTDVLSA